MELIEKLTAVADAIRSKTGGTDEMTLDQMAAEIAGIQTGGGGTDLSAGLLMGTLTEYESEEVTNLRGYAFYQHTTLQRVILPNLEGAAGTNPFRNCSALVFADLGICKIIGATAFTDCTVLKTVILRQQSCASLLNVSAFARTPFASGGTGGTVYVPSALIETYKTATNWSTLYAAGTCNFVAIEGSDYE